MTRFILTLALAVVCSALGPHQALGQRAPTAGDGVATVARLSAQSACLPADRSIDALLSSIRSTVDTTSAADTVVRRKLRIPAMSPDSVYLVTDSTVCRRAHRALDSVIHAGNPSAPGLGKIPALYVIRAGNAVIVQAPFDRRVPVSPVHVFDAATWELLGLLLIGG